jgi:hypothetical protein
VARQARVAREADRRLRRLRGPAGRQLRRSDRPVHRGQPALLLRPAQRSADGDLQGSVFELPPRRLPGGADPAGRAGCPSSPASASTITARSRRARSTRASPRASSWPPRRR